jgi:hypothetical protein
MHRRALHLASFLLLLSTLGMAESAATCSGDHSLGAHYISVLLAQHEAAALAEATERTDTILVATELPATSLAQVKTPWTMRPAAAHSVMLHAVTGSSL